MLLLTSDGQKGRNNCEHKNLNDLKDVLMMGRT
jgi:hypothetical protein